MHCECVCIIATGFCSKYSIIDRGRAPVFTALRFYSLSNIATKAADKEEEALLCRKALCKYCDLTCAVCPSSKLIAI